MARPGGDELAFALLRPKAEVAKLVEKVKETPIPGLREGVKGAKRVSTAYGMKFVGAEYVADAGIW